MTRRATHGLLLLFLATACSTESSHTASVAAPSPEPARIDRASEESERAGRPKADQARIDRAALGRLPPFSRPDCRYWPESCTAAPGQEKTADQGRWQNFHLHRLAVRDRDVRVCDLAMAYRDGAATRPASEAIANCRGGASLEIAVLENDVRRCADEHCTRNFAEWKTLPPPNLTKVCLGLPDVDRTLCLKQRQEALGIR